jgi:hypothetical protein
LIRRAQQRKLLYVDPIAGAASRRRCHFWS